MIIKSDGCRYLAPFSGPGFGNMDECVITKGKLIYLGVQKLQLKMDRWTVAYYFKHVLD
jgi:hypothetical protein